MAITLTYYDAWNATANQRPRDDGGQQEYANQLAVNKMWRAYDWRGSLVKLPPFWLEPYVQDYGALSIPSDFLGFREVYLAQPSGASPVWSPQLRVVHNLEQTEVPGIPNSIVYREAQQSFRVHPRPGGGVSAPNYLILGTYKKQPPKIARTTDLGTLLPWDDTYFDVFCGAVVWAALLNSGQRDAAVKQDLIFKMLLAEATIEVAREHGEDYIHPGEGLMDSYGYGSRY